MLAYHLLLPLSLSLSLLAPTLASPGDVCRSSQGSGTCKSQSSCTTGFTVDGACPNDPASIKCCILATCKDASGSGTCLDKSTTQCSGGNFKPGLCPGGNNVQCCIKPTAKPTDAFVAYICQLYNLAKQYGRDRPANQLVMEWLRHTEYNGLEWTALIGGIDDGFTRHVQAAGVTMLDTFPDPEYAGLNVKISHFGACMNGVFLKGKPATGDTNRGDVAGWGGDWMTFYGEWRRDAGKEPSGGAYTRAHMANLVDDTTFKMRDLVEDADCYNIGMKLHDNPSLSIADEVESNLASGYKTRMKRFVKERFANNAAAIAKNMLLKLDDPIIAAGRIRLVQQQGGTFAKQPQLLSDADMNDLTAGFKDRLNAVVAEEAKKYPSK
ncbi:MAG: hypothetical protein Q9217_003835 [Psora testacea]